ncbi:hypothetical protein [Halomicrococcus sp. SG-WS-1]|uniref:hypothetical protein n=1 Tax=Halomicrococcus sp. SG-WS-1 TaxID=3439057 RepID=UPI003F7A18B6
MRGRERRTAEWYVTDAPTDCSLHAVVATVRGPVAVGEDGRVLARHGGEWRVVVAAGPATRANTLTCVDATDDGERAWFAGSSGALGAYDAATGRKFDYSAPTEKTSTWEAIAVAGDRGDERLRVANGSGEVMAVATDDRGCPQWDAVVEPGCGATVSALDFGGGRAWAVDTSGEVTAEFEDDWWTLGVRDAQVDFFDVAAGGERTFVAGDDGRLYRYDRRCENWTPLSVGESALYGIDRDGTTLLAAGEDGVVAERVSGVGWLASSTPAEADLRDVAVGRRFDEETAATNAGAAEDATTERRPDVAVGDDGTIIER